MQTTVELHYTSEERRGNGIGKYNITFKLWYKTFLGSEGNADVHR